MGALRSKGCDGLPSLLSVATRPRLLAGVGHPRRAGPTDWWRAPLAAACDTVVK